MSLLYTSMCIRFLSSSASGIHLSEWIYAWLCQVVYYLDYVLSLLYIFIVDAYEVPYCCPAVLLVLPLKYVLAAASHTLVTSFSRLKYYGGSFPLSNFFYLFLGAIKW